MHKKKIAKKIIIPVILLVMIASAVCIFAINKKPKTSPPPVSQVSQNNNNIDKIEAIISADVINQKVCSEFNGNYVYKSIKDVSFNKDIPSSSESLTYEYISGYPDKNTFLYFLNKKKVEETKNEIITLISGSYTKTINSTKVSEGIYYGNLDKSYIYIENEKGSIDIDETKYSIELEISFTGYWLDRPPVTPSSTKIYVREKYIYDELASNFLYVTYVYEMITD